MFLTRISINNPIFATMIMVAVTVFGLFAYLRLPIEQMPSVDEPTVSIVVGYPGAAPETVEADVVRPIEEAVNTMSGLAMIQSTAQTGRATITLTFGLNESSIEKAQEVRDKLDPVRAAFPSAVDEPQVLRFNFNSMPIMSLAISSATMADRDLTGIAKDIIAKRIANIPGVGSATVIGGVARQVNILIDPDRLHAFNISAGTVISALRNANRDLAAGAMTADDQLQTIQVLGRVEQAADFGAIIVGVAAGSPIHLSDVATIEDGGGEATSLAILNGTPALAIDVVKTEGANTVTVAHAVETAIEAMLATEFSDGAVQIDIVDNNALSIEESFHAVQNMLIEGALLAVAIVFLFLNSWRSTVITSLTLPISIIGTMIALYAFGFTLNLMTMLGLSLAIGILIDDAIVVRENITRHLHMGKSHRQAAFDGTNEIGLAVLATTFAIIAVFLPVALMEGIIGRLFLQFGVTVSVAVLISLFVAFTLDPMLSSVWHDPASRPDARRGPIGRLVQKFDLAFGYLTEGYRRVLRLSLKFRKTVLTFALGSFGVAVVLMMSLGFEFLPASDNGKLTFTVETPAGSSKEFTASKVRQAEALVHSYPEVLTTYASIGGGESGTANSATVNVTFVSKAERVRTPNDITPFLRRDLLTIPGARFEIASGSGFGDGTAPVAIAIYGERLDMLTELADQLVTKLVTIEGLVDISSSVDEAEPVIGIRVNDDLAQSVGVSAGQVAETLSPLIGGEEVADWTSPSGSAYDVMVRLPAEIRNDVDAIGNLPISQSGSSGSSEMVMLNQVAEIVPESSPAVVSRRDLQRSVTVEAHLEGVELGTVTPEVEAAMQSLALPSGYRIGFVGDAEMLGDTASSMLTTLVLAVTLIYLVLASQFGSLLQPLAIMGSLPLALIGVVIGLMVGGSTLNVYSAIGFIMLMGLVVKNAILLVDNANQHVRQGWNVYEALVEAGVTRFRPIIMTTLAMIFGMVPLAINLHGGSGENAPMAHAVIGGLISSTVLTLVVVPVLLTYLSAFGAWARQFLPKSPKDHDEPAAT